jgi:hypothetical protein
VPGGSKKESKTWLYERGATPRLVLIKDEIAVEPNFYSEPASDGSKTLDDDITDYENIAAPRLQTLKGATLGSVVDSAAAAEIVSHLTIRNAHLRRGFTMAAKKMFVKAVDVFGNEARLRPLLGIDHSSPSQAIKDIVDEQLKIT